MTKVKRKDILNKKDLKFGKKYAKNAKKPIKANDCLIASYQKVISTLKGL